MTLVQCGFVLVVYNDYCPITHRYEKFDVKKSNGLEISLSSSTVYTLFECSRVISYI